MIENSFDDWLEKYLKTRAKAAKILSKTLSDEVSELVLESQQLEPLRFEAEEARSFAELYAHGVKDKRRVWALANTKGLCASTESRAFKVSQHLRRLDKNIE